MQASPLIYRTLYLFFATLLLVACQQDKPYSKNTNAKPVETEPALTFIVHPYDNPSRLVERFTPLCDYLGDILGRPVKLLIARSYVDQIQRIANGQADLAYMGPTPYLRAQDHYLLKSQDKLIPLAAEIKGGKASYHSVIVVRNDSSITQLEDLSGRNMAFGSPHSFSSHYVPRVLLGNAGISFQNLKDFAFLGSHERVALAVLHADFDAGGLNRAVAQRYQDRFPGLRIIATSPALAPHMIVASPLLTKSNILKIKAALLKPDEHSTQYLKAIRSFGSGTQFSKPVNRPFEAARKIISAVEAPVTELKSW